jgi:hypothetical protein
MPDTIEAAQCLTFVSKKLKALKLKAKVYMCHYPVLTKSASGPVWARITDRKRSSRRSNSQGSESGSQQSITGVPTHKYRASIEPENVIAGVNDIDDK